MITFGFISASLPSSIILILSRSSFYFSPEDSWSRPSVPCTHLQSSFPFVQMRNNDSIYPLWSFACVLSKNIALNGKVPCIHENQIVIFFYHWNLLTFSTTSAYRWMMEVIDGIVTFWIPRSITSGWVCSMTEIRWISTIDRFWCLGWVIECSIIIGIWS